MPDSAPPAGNPAPLPESPVPPAFLESRPELLILDVDGVLTDNTIWLDEQGREQKRFFVPDGTGIYLLGRVGIPVALVSGRPSGVVDARARELRIDHAYSGVKEKLPKVKEIIATLGLSADRTVYMGDDWIDAAPMGFVGLPVAVWNAIPEIRDLAVATTSRPGGSGAVREVCDWILRARGDDVALRREFLGDSHPGGDVAR